MEGRNKGSKDRRKEEITKGTRTEAKKEKIIKGARKECRKEGRKK